MTLKFACWLLPLAISAIASANTIPLTSTGALVAFDPTQNVVFNTSNGTYQVGSTVMTGGRAVTLYSNGFPTTYVFDFSSIDIAAGINVTATGANPLFLLAQTSAVFDGVVNLSGATGSAGGTTGGGGGGGALGIFAGSISVGTTGALIANGGDGGLSDAGAANVFGGLGALREPGLERVATAEAPSPAVKAATAEAGRFGAVPVRAVVAAEPTTDLGVGRIWDRMVLFEWRQRFRRRQWRTV